MRKTNKIVLGVLALAAAMTACKDTPDQDVRTCTDKNGQIVDDKFCQVQPQTANGQNPNDDHLVRDILLYHWMFGGNFNGQYVTGGGYHPSPRIVYVPAFSSTGSAIRSAGSARSYTSVSRGGFGSSFGGGEGAGE